MSIDNSLFEELERLYPGGKASTWYVYAALIFQTYDCMDLIGLIWKYVVSSTPVLGDQVTKGRKIREALLKASVLVGFPKGINACMSLRQAILTHSPELECELDKAPTLRSTLSQREKDVRGKAFFSKIYDKHTDRVLNNMSLASGGDLSAFAVSAIYGDLMAEETRLDAKETALLEFLACYATGGSAWAQAKGHMFGCHNLGNSKAEIYGVVAMCSAIEEALNIQSYRLPAENWTWIKKAGQW